MPFADRVGQRLFYEEINSTVPWVSDAQTIIFHHGIGTTSGVWADWLPVLGPSYRLVRLDMRGFGQSPTHSKANDWSFELLAADLLATADAVGASRFHLVGESIGGTLGLHFALHHPDRLHSLTVSNGAHRGTAVRNVNPWREMIDRDGQEAWSRQLMEWRFFPDALSEEKYRWFHRTQSTCSADATLDLARLLLNADLSDEVSKIKLPTLLLSPDSSPFIPVSIMADLYARLENAELQVFARSRHGLPYSHGSECATVLKRFLKDRFESAATRK
jgi:pimeloyl-ACP methyl ester carboxylesterase